MSPISQELPFTEKDQQDSEQTTNSSTIRKSLRKPSRNQIEIQFSCLDELIPEDHRARDVWEFVCQMDFSDFHDVRWNRFNYHWNYILCLSPFKIRNTY